MEDPNKTTFVNCHITVREQHSSSDCVYTLLECGRVSVTGYIMVKDIEDLIKVDLVLSIQEAMHVIELSKTADHTFIQL